MKNYVICLMVMFALVACKKDRVCNCTITDEGETKTRSQLTGFSPFLAGTDTTVTQPLNRTNTQKKKYTKVTKKQMRANCMASSDETINRSSNTTIPGIYTITTTDSGTRTYDCKIE
jgi:hypothetical protein